MASGHATYLPSPTDPAPSRTTRWSRYVSCHHFCHSLIRSQVSFTKPDGTTIDRLPPWITRVTQDLSVSPVYDGRFWNPPASEKYTFKHPRPAPIGGKDSTGGLKIYEAHGKSLPGSHHVGTDPWQSASRPRNPKSAATSSSGTMSSRESPSSATTASK